MVNLSKFYCTLNELLDLTPDSKLLLTGCHDWYKYVDGQRTDEVIGKLYSVIKIGEKSSKKPFPVKVKDLTTAITDDELETLMKDGQIPFVEFENALCRPYIDSKTGLPEASIIADSITLI